jgi:DNA-binding PadR family transcriptional regulator
MVADRRLPARAESFLPLTPLMVYLLLSLAEAPAHGYALVGRIRERSGGIVDPGTGSFYSVIRSAVDAGLIAEDQAGIRTDARRRQFMITELGRRVLAAETHRLADVLTRTRQVLRVARKRT